MQTSLDRCKLIICLPCTQMNLHLLLLCDIISMMSPANLKVVMEYDGVLVEDTSDIQRKAWQKMAEEEGKRAVPQFLLQRADGMKNDQVSKPLECMHSLSMCWPAPDLVLHQHASEIQVHSLKKLQLQL